jgi:hypothetical protein
MYTLNSGMTELERQGLFRTMSQVFDHHFANSLEEYRKVNEGEAITMPKNAEHAKAMMGVGQWYLDNQEWTDGVLSGSYRDWVKKQYN